MLHVAISLTYSKISKSEKTRNFIIEKVAPIFNIKGFAGTSLSDMTEATNLTKGAIYGNFKNKDEIALEAFKHNFSLPLGIFNAEIKKGATPLDKLRLLPSIYLKIYPKIHAIGGCPILNTIVDSDDSHILLKELSAQTLKGLKTNLEKILADCVVSKQIREDANTDRLAALFLTLIEGGILIARTMDDETYFQDAVQQMESIINELVI